MTVHPSPRCRQCGSLSTVNLGRIPDADVFAGQPLDPPWDGGCLHECRDCHLGFRHPLRGAEDYERLYAAASESVWVSPGLRPDQERVVKIIESTLTAGSVLDVGCYDGTLLQALGPAVRKYGIEPSLLAAQAARAKGVEIVASKVGDLGAIDKTFDVICAVDVIEHLTDPGGFVKSLLDVLAPGGLLLISTGSMDTPAWRSVGGRYWYCGFPEHISFVSPAWGRRVAARLGLALCEVERFVYDQLADKQRATAGRRFRFKAVRSNLLPKLVALITLGRGEWKPRRSIGRPGIFADHVMLGFRKAAELPPA